MRAVFLPMIGAGLLAASGAAFAQEAGDASYISVLGDFLAGPDNQHVPELDQGIGIDLRYGSAPASGLGYEFRVFYATYEFTDTTLEDRNHGGLGANLLYRLPAFAGLTPYALAGGGYVYADRLPEPTRAVIMVDAGAGLITRPFVEIMGFPLRARLEARYSLEDFDEAYLDLHAFAGFELVIAELPPPPPPPPEPEPVSVVEVEEAPAPPPPSPQPLGPLDGDGDGVTDDRDRCPNTPAGARVDAEGCSILKVLTLKGVNFELDSDRLRPESQPILDDAAATLTREFPDARIEVAGHTDSTGADSYNQELSMRRANSVRIYLIDQGVDGDRLTAVGYGEAEPVADNTTAEGRAENRRVELRVKEGSGPGRPRSSEGPHPLNPGTRR